MPSKQADRILNANVDYIIVGGGAAGCVLANRLSYDRRNTVLLLEAGQDVRPDAIPRNINNVYPLSGSDPALMWPELRVREREGSETSSQCQPKPYPQGRVLGGSGSINGMMALRGLPADFDDWERDGASGWGWDRVLPYFRRLEHDLDFGGPLHSRDGPVPIRRYPQESWGLFARSVGSEFEAHGFPRLHDHNGEFGDGHFGVAYNNLPSGRYSSAIAYLTAEVRARPNLQIACHALAEEIIFDGLRAVGVRVRTSSGVKQCNAREIILCAGALHSPALLQRSGIGPAALLTSVGITPKLDRTGVGKNLQNHPVFFVAAHLKRSARQRNRDPIVFNALRYSSSGHARAGSSDMFLAVGNNCGWHSLAQAMGGLGVAVYKPLSKGNVSIASADPSHEPKVDFNLLSDPHDLERMMEGVDMALNILRQPSVAALINERFIATNGALAGMFSLPTVRNLVASRLTTLAIDLSSSLRKWAIRRVGPDPIALADDRASLCRHVHAYSRPTGHPVGTCKMGREDDPSAVVDSNGNVIGLIGIRVADASVMPAITRANTNIPTIMIAEKISSDVIK